MRCQSSFITARSTDNLPGRSACELHLLRADDYCVQYVTCRVVERLDWCVLVSYAVVGRRVNVVSHHAWRLCPRAQCKAVCEVCSSCEVGCQ